MMTYAEKVKSWLCNGTFEVTHSRIERSYERIYNITERYSMRQERYENDALIECITKRARRKEKREYLEAKKEFENSKFGKKYLREIRREQRILAMSKVNVELVEKHDDLNFIIEDSTDIVKSLSKSPKQVKIKCIIPESGPYRTTIAIDEPWEVVRDVTLLEKIKFIINNFKRVRLGLTAYQYYEYMEPQMDGVRGEELSQEITSNVVLTEENKSSIGTTAVKPSALQWHTLSSTEFTLDYELLLNRNTYYGTYTWSTSQSREDVVHTSALPREFIHSCRNDGSMPMVIPFKIHRYWRGDIVLKLHTNSNKFQTGQLQCSWNYMRDFDSSPLASVFECCQLPHVLINAGSSNEAELRIPYKSIRPFVHTRQRIGYGPSLYLGNFTMRVLVPLRTSTNGPKKCNITVFIRFENNNFTGLIDGNLVEPQMMAPLAMMAACKIVDKVVGDSNCDNNITQDVPKYLVPTASHSWSIGNGAVENIHNLRLFNTNAGVGRTSELDANDLLIKTPASVFGMLDHITWDADSADNNKTGKCLWSMDVHPQSDKSKMHKFTQQNLLDSYCMPPVGVVSSMFMYWRGSLEFRFDIVASQFHTGRLMVAYIPGMHSDIEGTVSLEQARNSAHAIFTLQDSASFSVTVPFISDKPWWYRKYGGPQRRTEFSAPSRLYLFIINPLVKMESVTKTVTIIPYMRAGLDFELAVPVQPAIGLSYNRANPISNKYYLRAVDGYYPYYVGSWHSFASSLKAILRYGPVSDHVAQFIQNSPVLEDDEIVYYEGDPAKMPTLGLSTGNYVNVKYIVPYVTGGYVYAIPFPDDNGGKDRAIKAASALKRGDNTSFLANCYDVYGENSSLIGKGNPLLKPIISKIYEPPGVHGFEIVQPEMDDERVSTLNSLIPTSSLPTTGSGMLTFGEAYTDIKDLLRRYHLYWEGVVPLDNSVNKMEAFIRFPVVPGGLDLDVTASSHWNYLRDGVLSIVNSGYFFFRGGMRFKVVFPSSLNKSVWVQHHPDMPNDQGRSVTLFQDIKDSDRFKNHAYAMYIQSTFINNVLEFEIPFYQPGMYGMSRFTSDTYKDKDLNDYSGLGDIVIGFENECIVTPMPLSIYASVADDFSLSTFRGFNAVVMCDETFARVDPQMMDAVLGSLFGTVVSKVASSSIKDVKNSIRQSVHNEVRSAIAPSVANISKAIQDVKEDVKEETVNWCKNQAIMTAFGNLMHILVNPSIKTVALAVSNVLVSLIVGSVNVLTSFNNVLITFFSKFWDLFNCRVAEKSNVVEPQMEETMDKACVSILSVIFTAIAATIGYIKSDKPGTYFNLMKNINITASLGNNVLSFIKNCNEAIVYFYQWILLKVNPRASLENLLDNAVPDIKDWYKECSYLVDSRLKPRMTYEKQLISRVFDACVFGSIMILNGIDSSTKGGKILLDMYKEICKLRNDLIERGAHPDVRFECYPIWFSGKAGIGKSYLTTQFVNDLLKSVKYTGAGSLIYYLIPGLKHWSGVQNPAALVSDDIFQVDGQKMEEELSNLFSICSSSVLNPPMAAIADKERRLNPLLYIMHCNYSFPEISAMRCADAVYRRRKQLIEVDLTDEIKEKYPNFVDASELSVDELRNFGHLKFRIALNPKNIDTTYTPWMSYEALRNYVVPRFVNHYERERLNFKRRMCDMYSLDPNFNQLDLFDELPILRDQLSLKEQIATFKARVRAELYKMDDPLNADELPFVERLQKRIEDFKNRYFSPEMDEEVGGMYSDMMDRVVTTMTIEEFYSQWMWSVSYIDKDFAVVLNEDIDLTTITCDDILKMSIKMREINDAYTMSARSNVGCRPRAYFTMPAANMSQQVRVDFETSIFFQTIVDMGVTFSGASSVPDAVIYIKDAKDLCGYLRGVIHAYTEKHRMDFLQSETRQNRLYERSEFAADLIEIGIGTLAQDPYCTSTPDQLNAVGAQVSRLLDMFFGDLICCKHSRFWYDALNDMEHVTYCDRQKLYFYKNCLGITTSSPAKCSCKGSPLDNNLFAYFIARAYSLIHAPEIELELRDRPTGLFQRSKQLVLDLWFESIVPTVKCWWRHYVCPAIACILDFIILHLPKIIMFVSCVLIATGAAWAADKIEGIFKSYNEGDHTFESQGANYFKFEQPRAQQKQSFKNADKTFQQQSSPQQRAHLAKRIENNTVLIHATWISGQHRMVRQCRCLMLYGRKMLVLRHYMEEFSEIYKANPDVVFKLFFNVSGKVSSTEIHYKHLFADIVWACVNGSYEHTNFGVVCLPKHIIQFKNILPLIATKAQHDKIASVCDIYALGDTTSYDLPIESKTKFIIAGTENSSEVILDKVYSYMRQDKGLCGSVVVSNNINAGSGAIIGIHVGGSPISGLGIAEPIYREALETLQGLRPDKELMEMPLLDCTEAEVQLTSNLVMYGCVPPQFSHKESGKTKIVPSLLHGAVYPVRTEVNPLRPNDPRQPPGSHPLRDGCNKHGSGDVRPFDPDLVEEVRVGLSEQLNQVIKPVRNIVKPLTLQQAICGDCDIPYFESLNWKSSEGFPLVHDRPKSAHDKRWLFELEEGKFGYKLININEKLKQQLKLRDLCFERNVKPVTIYVDCLKDYRLTSEKCKEAGKTRIFSIAPVQCSIDIRMHMNDFCAGLKASRIDNMIGIGINPDSIEWTKLVNYLHEVGNNIITLDYKNYGPCLMSQLVASASDLIGDWYVYNNASEEHVKRVRWLLDCDILNPVHLTGNLVNQSINGISSGSPLTGECNSIPNIYYIMLTYLTIMKRFMPEYASTFYFFSFVRLVVYGDDLIMSVDDCIKDLFNAISIRDVLLEHGIRVTSASKDSDLKPYGTITDATFLKRSFLPHPRRSGIWLAPVEVSSVEECLNWVHVSDNPNEALLEVCRASMDLAFGHGPIYYDKHKRNILKALSRLNLVLTTKTWSERDVEIFSNAKLLDVTKPDLLKIKVPWIYNSSEN